jgi:negative regulator of sigma E activity
MTEERQGERPSERSIERHSERDSQLSAMFDDELPAGECELLARRLAKDESLRAQWSRYSMIGAALRAERGVVLHDRVAWRVQNALAQEPSYGEVAASDNASSSKNVIAARAGKSTTAGERWMRFARPVAGASIAAGVAAVSIMWLRNQEGPAPIMASTVAPSAMDAGQAMDSLTGAAPATAISNGEPDRYVTPQPSTRTSIGPPARLANYVVAHSEYSGPLSRRLALLGLVATDPADVALPEPESIEVNVGGDAEADDAQ